MTQNEAETIVSYLKFRNIKIITSTYKDQTIYVIHLAANKIYYIKNSTFDLNAWMLSHPTDSYRDLPIAEDFDKALNYMKELI